MLEQVLQDGIKNLKINELESVAQEIRQVIVKTVSSNGGHLASNLGMVELTLALHYTFNPPNDKIIFDVGHQSYTHKILSGRLDKMHTLRKPNGISGFPKREESEFDAFNTGHASTALSAALGFAKARDLTCQSHEVIAVVGDGAFGGGMVYEALNNLQTLDTKVIIVLNDNQMSIAKSVGATAGYLTKLRINLKYRKLKKNTKKVIGKIPLIGKPLCKLLEKIKHGLSAILLRKISYLEHFGIKYIGPIDGNDISDLVKTFKKVKSYDKSVLLHVVTKKGKGSLRCENKPENFHGVKGCVAQASACEYSHAVAYAFEKLGKTNKEVVAISAAMADAVGLGSFASAYPQRFVDVGICESHAVTLCAGLAAAGLKPYFAVYSTFLQRGFDQILHDVALQNLPVTFLIDRAGVVGDDGETHQGVFDLSYLSLIPNLTIACPKDVDELIALINFSKTFNAPLAIRYPRESKSKIEAMQEITNLNWQTLQKSASNNVILFAGERMWQIANGVNQKLNNQVSIINCRFIKPLDTKILDQIKDKNIFVLEDNVRQGGLAGAILLYYASKNITPSLKSYAYPDEFIAQGQIDSVIESYGISQDAIASDIKSYEN